MGAIDRIAEKPKRLLPYGTFSLYVLSFVSAMYAVEEMAAAGVDNTTEFRSLANQIAEQDIEWFMEPKNREMSEHVNNAWGWMKWSGGYLWLANFLLTQHVIRHIFGRRPSAS